MSSLGGSDGGINSHDSFPDHHETMADVSDDEDELRIYIRVNYKLIFVLFALLDLTHSTLAELFLRVIR